VFGNVGTLGTLGVLTLGALTFEVCVLEVPATFIDSCCSVCTSLFKFANSGAVAEPLNSPETFCFNAASGLGGKSGNKDVRAICGILTPTSKTVRGNCGKLGISIIFGTFTAIDSNDFTKFKLNVGTTGNKAPNDPVNEEVKDDNAVTDGNEGNLNGIGGKTSEGNETANAGKDVINGKTGLTIDMVRLSGEVMSTAANCSSVKLALASG
jgi:hypothetical protein